MDNERAVVCQSHACWPVPAAVVAVAAVSADAARSRAPTVEKASFPKTVSDL